MDLLAQLFAATPAPDADFWYGPVGTTTSSGLKVDADGANKISAWFRGRELLSGTFAMLPCPLMERLPDGQGSEPAVSHPLYDVLHRSPNVGDDDFVWKRQIICDLIDTGHSYHDISIGRTWALDRIAPNLVTPKRITKGALKGQTVFHVRDEETGQTTVKSSDDIFHLQSTDGRGILERARESLGLALVTEQYASRIFSKGMLHGGTIEVPGPMNPESSRAMALSFVTAAGEWHMPRVLPMGAKLAANGDALTPEKAQMLLSRKFSVNDIARWLGLPPHMLSDLDRSTNNNIEHQGQEFVTYSLGSWLKLFESAVNKQLILQPNRFFVEFTRDALVRGDIAARWQAYTAAVTTGTFTRNEIRELENRNPLPGLDKPLDPAHLTGKQPTPKKSPSVSDTKAEAIVFQSASRVLRKEITAMQKLAVRHAADADAFAVAVTDFYAKHVELVAETLQLPAAHASEYCASQSAQVLADWVGAVEYWATDGYASGLAGLALEEAAWA